MVDTRKPRKRKAGGAAATRAEAPLSARTVFTLSEDETTDLGRALARGLKGGELILLDGDLGLGKTVFVRGMAEGLGIAPEDVSSPSFTLVQEYRGGRIPMFHVDLYRIEVSEEMGTLGIEEILTAGGVVAVEWGEKLPPYLRRGAVLIRFHDLGEGSRRVEILPEPKVPIKRRGDA